MKLFNKFIATSAVAVSLAGSAYGAGFAVQETSGTQLGNAFAGAGAQTRDVSGVWNNPAIAAFMETGWHAAVQGSLILPKSQFNNDGSTGVFAAGDDANGGKTAFVPSLYGLWALHDIVRIGLAIASPFGLATKYPSDWRGRFKAVESDLLTINVNPFVSIKIHEKVSLAIGASIQYAKIKLTSKIFNGLVGGAGEADFEASGSDFAYGFNAGLFFKDIFWEGLNIGLAYRSGIRHKLSGDRTVTGLAPNPAAFPGSGVLTGVQIAGNLNLDNNTIDINAALNTPESVAIYLTQAFTETFTMMLTAMWTRWTSVPEIKINANTGGTVGNPDPLNWANAWFLSIGAQWQFHEDFLAKVGFAYDQTPTQDETRSPRLPGNDRFWASAGIEWQASECMTLGLSYTHVFIRDAKISNNLTDANPAIGALKGNYCSSVDIIGVQANFKF